MYVDTNLLHFTSITCGYHGKRFLFIFTGKYLIPEKRSGTFPIRKKEIFYIQNIIKQFYYRIRDGYNCGDV